MLIDQDYTESVTRHMSVQEHHRTSHSESSSGALLIHLLAVAPQVSRIPSKASEFPFGLSPYEVTLMAVCYTSEQIDELLAKEWLRFWFPHTGISASCRFEPHSDDLNGGVPRLVEGWR